MHQETNQHKAQAARKTAIVSAAVNGVLSVTKIIGGTLSGSTAVLADGIHSLADLATDIFTWAMLLVSHQAPDDTHPYGHGKFETFGTLVLSVLLALSALWIAWQATDHLIHGGTFINPQFGPLALGITVFSILANEGLFHYCLKIGKKVDSPIVIANAWHHRSDALSSIAALLGLGFTLAGYPAADAIAALIVTILLFKISFKFGHEAFNELVDAAVDDPTQQRMFELIKNCEGVLDCHFLRARKLGGDILVDLHVDVSGKISVSEGHAISETVEQTLKEGISGLTDVVVHIDPHDGGEGPYPTFVSRKKLAKTIETALKQHLPNSKMSTLTLHLLRNHTSAEIILKSNVCPTPQATKSLKKALEKPSGPFESIVLLHPCDSGGK